MMNVAQLKRAAHIAFLTVFFVGLFMMQAANSMAAEAVEQVDVATSHVEKNDVAGEIATAEKGTTIEKSAIDSTEKKPSSLNSVMADNNVTSNLLQTTLGLLTVLALIAAAAWAVKRFGGFRATAQGQMKVVGGVSVGTRERVVLLQVGEQQLVIGVAPGQIRTLHVLDAPLPGADGNRDAHSQSSEQSKNQPTDSEVSFASRFKAALKQNAIKGMGGK